MQLIHVLHVDSAPLFYYVSFNHYFFPWELLPDVLLFFLLGEGED